ncbi:MAG: PAS domain-containing protein [Cyanobacteria bacterium J06597_16]
MTPPPLRSQYEDPAIANADSRRFQEADKALPDLTNQTYVSAAVESVTDGMVNDDAVASDEPLIDDAVITDNATDDNATDEDTRFHRWADGIPGAVSQVVTTRDGLVIASPYLNTGCYKLLEISSQNVEPQETPCPQLASSVATGSGSTGRYHPLFDVIHPDDWDSFELAMSRAAREAHRWEWEGRIVLAKAKTKWIFLALQPAATQPDKETILWNLLAQDITAHKRTEGDIKQLNHLLSSRLEARTAELAVSQTRLQKLADNVPDLLYEMRLTSASEVSFPYVSSDSYRLLSMSPEEFQRRGGDILALVHPDERQAFKEAIRESALTMQVYQYECRVQLPSGKLRWVRTLAKPQPQPDGSIVWYGCLSDISDRKQIEAKLQHSLKELADVKLALDCSSNVAITDHRGQITYVNDKFCEISKYSRAELIGQTHRLINSDYHPQEFFEEMWHTISTGHVWLGEMRNRAKTGDIYWVYTTVVPFLDDAGCPYQYVAIHNDITERKRAEICLVQQAHDLESAFMELQQTQTRLVQTEKMSSLGQLVAGVAHEINNPVSFIYGNVKPANRYAQSLIDLLSLYQTYYPDPPAEIADALEELDVDFLTEDLLKLLASMKLGAERIRQIVSSLRTFSRKDEAAKKSVDIHTGLDSTLMILGSQLKGQQQRPAIEVVKDYGELPPIFCYAGQLNQVFMNVLGNAIDALQAAEVPQLTISTRLDSGTVLIAIADNGGGMSEEVRSQIFNPFFTTKPIGQGTGMGLSISYQIVTDRHGGSLACDSTIGEGTLFTIRIPQSQPD